MKIIFSSLIFMLCTFTTLSAQLLSERRTEAYFAERSEFWPAFVRIHEPVEKHSGKGSFRAGWRFILITCQNGILTLDSGDEHYFLPIAKTNFVEQCQAIQAGSGTKILPNLTQMIGNKLFDPQDPLQAYHYKQLKEVSHYLIYYPGANYCEDEAALSEVKKLYALTSEEPSIELVMFPIEKNNHDLQANHREHHIPWTTLSISFTPGYERSLNHLAGEERQGQLVLVDANNKLLAHSSEVGTGGIKQKLIELTQPESLNKVTFPES